MISSSRQSFLIFLLLSVTFNFILTDDHNTDANQDPPHPYLLNQTYELINSLAKYVEEFRIDVASKQLNSSVSIPLLLPVGTTNLFGRLINMFYQLNSTEKAKRSSTMNKEMIKNVENYFNFIRELDDEECLAKMICEIGADPFEYGTYGKGMDKFFFNLNSTPIDNVNVKYYLRVYNLGNEEGLESCELNPCDQNMTKIAKYFNIVQFDRLMTGSPTLTNMDELNEISDTESESHAKTERDIFTSGWQRLSNWIGLGSTESASEYMTRVTLEYLYPPAILSAIPNNFLNYDAYYKPILNDSLLDTASSNHNGVIDDYVYTTEDEKTTTEQNEPEKNGFFSKFGFPFIH